MQTFLVTFLRVLIWKFLTLPLLVLRPPHLSWMDSRISYLGRSKFMRKGLSLIRAWATNGYLRVRTHLIPPSHVIRSCEITPRIVGIYWSVPTDISYQSSVSPLNIAASIRFFSLHNYLFLLVIFALLSLCHLFLFITLLTVEACRHDQVVLMLDEVLLKLPVFG